MDKPRLKRDWKGLHVRSLIELKNGHERIPSGTVFTVRENCRGLRLEGPKCPRCGVSVFITRVREWDVEII